MYYYTLLLVLSHPEHCKTSFLSELNVQVISETNQIELSRTSGKQYLGQGNNQPVCIEIKDININATLNSIFLNSLFVIMYVMFDLSKVTFRG